MRPSPPGRRHRRPTLLGVALAVTVLGSAGGCSFLPGGAEPAASPSASKQAGTSAIPGLRAGGPLTEADVKGLDPRAVYLASLKAQTLQPVINLKHELYRRKSHYPDGSRMAVVSGVDYSTKRVRLEKTQVIAPGDKAHVSYGTRCARGQEKFWSSAEDGWETQSSSCPSLASMAWLNDGLATGGMNETQSAAFMDYLGGIQGLINGESIRLATHGGKQYLRVAIKVKQVRLGGGPYAGAGLYGDAVKSAALDWATHPYGNLSGDGDLSIVRYVDPQTALPAYAETIETSALADDGRPMNPGAWEMHRVEYSFAGPVAASTLPRTPEITRLSWQPEP